MGPITSRKIPGFTLIELLVVIAIIAILASILFPVFARARENARRSSCQSNLKQIGLGIFQYTQDYDEKLPNGNFNNGGNAAQNARIPLSNRWCMNQAINSSTWMELVFPYTKSEQIYYCPSTNTQNLSKTSCPSNATGADNSFGYAFNPLVLRIFNFNTCSQVPPADCAVSSTYADITHFYSPFRPLSSINKPSETIMLTDHGRSDHAELYYTGGNGLYTNATTIAAIEPNSPAAFNFNPSTRHLDTANYLYCDGHVKAKMWKGIVDFDTALGDANDDTFIDAGQ